MSAAEEAELRRFTPTCVGRTTPCTPQRPPAPVHPHVRGEDSRISSSSRTLAGSPPRAWGGLGYQYRGGKTRRFTPTCVGRTWGFFLPQNKIQVHPHVRGEDAADSSGTALASGSPPRAWGGRSAWTVHGPYGGFTPTCVGRTCEHQPCSRTPWVHPHVRGEDRTRLASSSRTRGSPPRAWGGPAQRPAEQRQIRFTPTCVGRTTPPRKTPPWWSVHPHVRGEDMLGLQRSSRQVGSPPRAWGGPGRRAVGR